MQIHGMYLWHDNWVKKTSGLIRGIPIILIIAQLLLCCIYRYHHHFRVMFR